MRNKKFYSKKYNDFLTEGLQSKKERERLIMS